MVSSRHHHHISPLAIAIVLLLAGIVGGMQAGYFKGVFHQDILARVNPDDVLTPADLAPAHLAAGQIAAPTAQSLASVAR
jgi:membrane protein DedA with SNARE-associated domain